jgi:CheY-specific phosphatase CheX
MLVDGARPVSVGLSSDEGGCAKLAAAMFGCKPDGVDVGMVNDALRELVNMTAGLLKREMALDQALTVPVIVDDKEALRRSRANIPPWCSLLARSGSRCGHATGTSNGT